MFTKLISQARNLFYFLEVKRCRRKGVSPGSLLFPVIWITNRCNLKCRMCDQWKTNPGLSSEELSTKEWFRFIDSAQRMHAAAVVITGGEPLLREDIFDIIKYSRSKGIACHLCSNGTLLDRTAVERLKKSRLNSISVSLDSSNAEIHNKMRGAECFNSVVEGIRLLKYLAPEVRVGINYVIARLNLRGICQMVPLAESLGVDQIKFDILNTSLLHRRKLQADPEGLLLDKNDIASLKQELDNLTDAVSKTGLLTNSTAFLRGILNLRLRESPKYLCYAGYISCAVDPFGYVAPCDGMRGEMSLRDKTFEEICNSPAFQVSRRLTSGCKSRCWDTTHAELNIRCSGLGFLRELPQILREMRFYLG